MCAVFLKRSLYVCYSGASNTSMSGLKHKRMKLKEELAAMKKNSEAQVAAIKKLLDEAEAAQTQRDKEYEVLGQRTEENDAKVAQMLVLFGAHKN